MTQQKELTPQEQLFLDALFDGAVLRHPTDAKRIAGYPEEYPVLKIVAQVSEQLLKNYDNALLMAAGKAVLGLVDIMDNPNEPGAKIKLQAIAEILDRAGVVKKDKTEVAQPTKNFMFVLPPKETNIIKED